MWYVIQTKTGLEEELVAKLKEVMPEESCKNFLVPMFEEVIRTGGKSRISSRRIFPGYVLLESDSPEDLFTAGSRLGSGGFMKVLGYDGEASDPCIKAVNAEDMDFLQSILQDGIMSVSYVERQDGTRIKRIVGPLAKYGNRITKIEFRKRRAIVDTVVFGKQRRIKFGLWTKEDPEIPWIREALKRNDRPEFILEDYDIGLRPGDRVRDVTGLYKDEVFTVEKVNRLRRTIRTKVMMLGEVRDMELGADQVEKI